MLASVPPAAREIPQGRRELQVTQMMSAEPPIETKALEAITAATLNLAADHDVIRDEHTLEIYHHRYPALYLLGRKAPDPLQ